MKQVILLIAFPLLLNNKIATLNLIERLVMTLEESIKNKQKIETFKDMLITNNAKIEYSIDEVTYVMNTASQHKEEVVKNSSFPVLWLKLSVQIRSVILDKIYAFQNRKEWFCRYSLVLLLEMDSFYPIINKISKCEKLQNQFGKELVFYYGLVIGLYRFVEGVSWGYSTLLTHKKLDNDNLTNIKVLYNFMIRLKRFFLVKKK